MFGPNMSKKQYDSMTKVQKGFYWIAIVVACAFFGYVWFVR